MLRLRPFHKNDAAAVVSWLKDETAFRKWCADRFPSYPITADELNAHYDAAGENFFAMTAFDDTGIIGQLIMRFINEEKTHLRFGFIIVDDSIRGKGYGKGMLKLSLRYAFDILMVEKVSLGVFENNPSAMHCYNAAGFGLTGESSIFPVLDEDWKCLEMEVTKEDFYANN